MTKWNILRSAAPALLVWVFLFATSVLVVAQPGQRIILESEAGRPSFDHGGGAHTLSSQNVRFQVVDNPVRSTIPNRLCPQPDGAACGWYKGFWVFGDGNFQKFDDDIRNLDASSLQNNYTYTQSGEYNAFVFLTEKYHNLIPPGMPKVKLTVPASVVAGGGVTPTVSPRMLFRPSQRAALEVNHPPRTSYPMVFASSFRPEDNPVAVYFFFNSLQNQRTGLRTPANLFRFTNVALPNYFEGQIAVDRFQTNDLSGEASQLHRTFDSCVVFSMQSIFLLDANARKAKNKRQATVVLSTPTEHRLFPIFSTLPIEDMPNDTLPTDSASVLMLVASYSPIEDRLIRDSIRNVALQFLDVDENMSIGDDRFIVGFNAMNLKIQASHDPNSLLPYQITDLGGGRYRVNFRLTICNQGQLPETRPSVTISDLTGGHYRENPVLLNFEGATFSGAMSGGEMTCVLDGFRINGVPNPYEPQCQPLEFSMITDLEGVQRLYSKDPRALKACVKFSLGTGLECSENEPLFKDELLENGKYPQETAAPENPDWLWLILAGLGIFGAFATLFGYYASQKKKKQSEKSQQ